MPSTPVTVVLGDRRYVVVPQKHTRIKAGVSRLFGSLADDGIALTDDGGMMAVVERKAYEAISIFIPDHDTLARYGMDTAGALMSRDDFMGTGADGDLHVPTVPEIREALSAGLKVNGLTGFTGLKELLPMDLIKALVSQQIAEAVATSTRASLQSSQLPSGESASTSSTTSDPTSSPAPTDSPSNGSGTSSDTTQHADVESFAKPL